MDFQHEYPNIDFERKGLNSEGPKSISYLLILF